MIDKCMMNLMSDFVSNNDNTHKQVDFRTADVVFEVVNHDNIVRPDVKIKGYSLT